MTKQALYLKWRPHTFDDVIGQAHVTRTLRNSIDSGRIRHAYLFSGPRGTGKTTTARLLADALGCRNMDLIEIDAASHTGVDDVRDLRDKIAFMPTEGRYKVYIIDEVHRFSGSAFDALLKTLEEPPEHAIFVLATTEIDKVPDTIKSRCLQFEFRRVPMTTVANRLQFIAEAEGLNIERSALELIARQGTGSVRDSISLLDQIVADPEEHITLAITQRILGTANSSAVFDLAAAIFDGDVVRGMQLINQAVDSGSDPRQLGQQLVEHLRYVLLAHTSTAELIEASDEARAIYSQQASLIDKRGLLKIIRVFNDAVNDQRSGWHPQLALELALVDSMQSAGGAAPSASSGAVVDMTAIEMHIEEMLEARLAGVQLMDAFSEHPSDAAPADNAVESAAFQPSGDGAVPLSQIQAKWGEARRAIKSKNKILDALLDHVEVWDVSGESVTLSVKNDVFLERLNTSEHRNMLNFVMRRLHNVPLQVRVILASEGATTSRGVPTDDPLVAAGRKLGADVRPHTDKRDN